MKTKTKEIDLIVTHIKDNIDGKLIYLTQYGSHLYGTNTKNSDLDFRGVFISSKKSLFLKLDLDEYNTELTIPQETLRGSRQIKVDIKLFSIYKFLKLCSKADTNALDVLFSICMDDREYHVPQYYDLMYTTESGYKFYVIQYIKEFANKLINSNRLESPCSYAFKQCRKYGIKDTGYKIMDCLLTTLKEYKVLVGPIKFEETTIKDLAVKLRPHLDGKYLKVDIINNNGVMEEYLNICGVKCQFNLPITTLIQRIENKLTKEYTSGKTKNAFNKTDWKALSHALRIVDEILDLLETRDIKFPRDTFIKDVKLGKIPLENVNNIFSNKLDLLLCKMESDCLGWRYDENFWNAFILKVMEDI